jgi:disulfide bond formation protein DsbB
MYRKKSFYLEQGLPLAWAIALVATIGSLYFSEVMGYVPCNLCWYQRIMIYPLVLLLGIATIRRDFKIAYYVLPMNVIGLSISIYHYLMEKTDIVSSSSAACGIVPCDAEYINWLGFITIPFLAGAASLLIGILMIGIIRANRYN